MTIPSTTSVLSVRVNANERAGVLTHPLDDDVRGFYRRWGFQDLPFDPRRAMFVRTIDLQRSFGGAAS